MGTNSTSTLPHPDICLGSKTYYSLPTRLRSLSRSLRKNCDCLEDACSSHRPMVCISIFLTVCLESNEMVCARPITDIFNPWSTLDGRSRSHLASLPPSLLAPYPQQTKMKSIASVLVSTLLAFQYASADEGHGAIPMTDRIKSSKITGLLYPRQNADTCPSGYGLCSDQVWCCPSGGQCCGDGDCCGAGCVPFPLTQRP